MSSERGNLVFHTGSTKNIEFRTGSQGKIKINEDDLAELFSQVVYLLYVLRNTQLYSCTLNI